VTSFEAGLLVAKVSDRGAVLAISSIPTVYEAQSPLYRFAL